MSITVNGRKIEFIMGESVDRLLKRLKFVFPLVIVKVDGQTIPKEMFIGKKLHDGARVEVIHLTSGG